MFSSKINSTPAADAVDLHRDAYNAAFYELGLRWHWDDVIYPDVLSPSGERLRLRNYLETQQPHLLKAYDADFLIDAIEAAKARCHATMTAAGSRMGAVINWAEITQVQVGV